MVTEEVKKAKQRKVSAAEAKAQRRKDKAATKEQARLILLGQAELPTGVKASPLALCALALCVQLNVRKRSASCVRKRSSAGACSWVRVQT